MNPFRASVVAPLMGPPHLSPQYLPILMGSNNHQKTALPLPLFSERMEIRQKTSMRPRPAKSRIGGETS